jgi:hypothetical protein
VSRLETVQELAERVSQDPGLAAQIRADPAAALKAEAGTPLQTDVWIYRIVVVALASVVLLTVIGAILMLLLASSGATLKVIPEGVIALAATSVGALGGLLAPSPTQAKSG